MRFAVTLGRFLLGLYFFLPGISKVTGYADTLSYMALHNIPAPDLLLPITIVLQIGGGVMLMIGMRVSQVALMFAGMTLIINLGMHDFWNVYEGEVRRMRRRISLRIWRFLRVCSSRAAPRAYLSTAC